MTIYLPKNDTTGEVDWCRVESAKTTRPSNDLLIEGWSWCEFKITEV